MSDLDDRRHLVGPDVSRFDRFARLYDLAMPPADAATLKRGLRYATRDLEQILDVGGGSGRAANALGGAIVVDPARGMLTEAREAGNEAVRGSAEQLPAHDESVDAVTIVDALHHFASAENAIVEAARVLRPGGVLVVREFDPGTLRGRALVALEHAIGFDSQFYESASLLETIRDSGLSPFRPEDGFAYTVVGVKPRARKQET